MSGISEEVDLVLDHAKQHFDKGYDIACLEFNHRKIINPERTQEIYQFEINRTR